MIALRIRLLVREWIVNCVDARLLLLERQVDLARAAAIDAHLLAGGLVAVRLHLHGVIARGELERDLARCLATVWLAVDEDRGLRRSLERDDDSADLLLRLALDRLLYGLRFCL